MRLFFFLISYHYYLSLFFFFFNDTATTEIYTLSLHDALPISKWLGCVSGVHRDFRTVSRCGIDRHRGLRGRERQDPRSEEHTSELQSHLNLVCRLLLEKKKKKARETCREDDQQARG